MGSLGFSDFPVVKESSKAWDRPWRQQHPAQLLPGESGTSPECSLRASPVSWSSKAGLHWCLNELESKFLLGRAFLLPVPAQCRKINTHMDVHRWREGGSSQLQLFQGRISYKSIIQFPSARLLFPGRSCLPCSVTARLDAEPGPGTADGSTRG